MQDLAKEYCSLFESLIKLCYENNLGDPFSYARGKEIYQAFKMNHTVASTYSKEDAIDLATNQKVEYKSTIGKSINATYNGISVFPTWEEQEKYLVEQKIGCYPKHYFFRWDLKQGNIVEVWYMEGDKVLSLLLPKIKIKFNKVKNLKDPRLGATLTKKEIYSYGTKLSIKQETTND